MIELHTLTTTIELKVLCQKTELHAESLADLKHDGHPDHPAPLKGAEMDSPDPVKYHAESQAEAKVIVEPAKDIDKSADDSESAGEALEDEDLDEDEHRVYDSIAADYEADDGIHELLPIYPKHNVSDIKIEIPPTPPVLNPVLIKALKRYLNHRVNYNPKLKPNNNPKMAFNYGDI